MEKELRTVGIAGMDEAPWGTHFCQFYQTKADLIDLLVPYFKAGLERECRPLGASTTLLPVAQRMDADSERVGELLLCQPDESSERDDIIASRKLSAKDALALFSRHRTGEVQVGQLTNLIAHVLPFRIP